MSDAAPTPTDRATVRLSSTESLRAAIAWVPVAAVTIGVIPRVWLPLLDRDAGLGVRLLWVLVLPIATMVLSALLGLFTWELLRRIALAKELTRDTIPRAAAFEEGGVTTLTGVIEGAHRASPLTNLPCVAWAQRAFATADVPWPCVVSHSEPFTLLLDDGARIDAEGGPWRVVGEFNPWTIAGEARIESGDRVQVRARVAVSLDPSDGDYRASAVRQTLVADGGLIAPVATVASRIITTRSAWGWTALACMAVLGHAIVRLSEDPPMHFNVALDMPCDGRHLCSSGSYCHELSPGRDVCRQDCTRDAQCGTNMRCDESSGRCELRVEDYSAPGTLTQGQDCTTSRCAPGFRCVRNLTRDDPDSGVYNGPESYCVRECRRDDQCPAGTVCTVISPESHPDAWCDRPENLMTLVRMMIDFRRDASVR